MGIFKKKTRISAQAIKTKADQISKRATKNARKRIRRGEIIDSHSLSLYLNTIDDRYAQLETEVSNAMQVVDYPRIRSNKIAETKKLIQFFDRDYVELNNLYNIVMQKAAKAKHLADFQHQVTATPIDLSKLRDELDKLEYSNDKHSEREGK